MKSLSLLFALATMQAVAQTDTLRTDTAQAGGEQRHSLYLGYSPGQGAGVRVDDGDPKTEQDTIRIELKRKLLTILVTPKDSMLVGDTLQEHIDALERERRNKFTYWSGLDIGLNNWVGADGSGDLGPDADFMQLDAARSRFFAINFMEQKIEFGSHRAGLLTGLGLEWTSYHLQNNVLLAYNADSVYGLEVDKPQYSKNKLRQTGIRLPLLFEFNTKRAPLPTTAAEVRALEKAGGYSRKGNFHFAVGVVGTWYFDTMYKVKYTEYGDKQKDRSGGEYHLLPYRAAATVRMGWGGWNFFGEYALTPLFSDGKGPELTPFNVGLTLVGFN
ncbi:MAG: hypothetical protein JNL05_01205 [Flavobacteriales bacterium]|nr:hypothetical protein [Flavobacteriales bacterium]